MLGDAPLATFPLAAGFASSVPFVPSGGHGLDLSNDYLIIDDTTSTQLEVKQGEGNWAAPVSIPATWWTAQNEDQASTDPLFSTPTRVCHIWRKLLMHVISPPPLPKRGDRITNSLGEVFIVRQVETMDWDQNGHQRYRLTATRTPL